MKGRRRGSLLGSLRRRLRLVRVLPVILDQLDDVCQVQAAGEDLEQHFILLHALHELFQGEFACESTFRKGLLNPAACLLPPPAASEQPPRSCTDYKVGPFLRSWVCVSYTPKPHADPLPAGMTRGNLQRPLRPAAACGGDGELNLHGEPLSASSPHVLVFWDIQHLELLWQTELRVRGKVGAVFGIA